MSSMTINGGSALANTHGVEGSEHANVPGRTTNFVTSQVAEQYANNQMQQSEGGHTDGSRGSTEPKAVGYADIQYSLNDRLANNAEYQELKKQQEALGQTEQDLALVMSNHFTPDDGFITLADLNAVANDGGRPQNVRDAAKRLLANNRAWTEITGDDGRATGKELVAYSDRIKTAMKGIKDAEEDQVRKDLGAAARVSANGGTPSTDGAGTPGTDGGNTPAPPSTETPKPPPSTRPGTEGALENLANGQEWIQKEIERLANEAAKDPAKAPALQARISMLQNQFQVLANMSTQINQMMSNITKMWSDIAMNSVRNIK